MKKWRWFWRLKILSRNLSIDVFRPIIISVIIVSRWNEDEGPSPLITRERTTHDALGVFLFLFRSCLWSDNGMFPGTCTCISLLVLDCIIYYIVGWQTFYDLFTLLSQIRANIAEVPTFYCWTGEIFCNVDILLQSSMDVQITIYRSFCCLRNLFFACGGYCLKFSFFPKLFTGFANDEWYRLFTSHLHINCVPNLAKRLEWKYLKNVRKYTVSDLCITGNSSHSVAISLIEDKHLPVQSQFATLFRHSRDNPSK